VLPPLSSEIVQAARFLIAGLKAGALEEAQIEKLVRAVGTTQRGATPEESREALQKLSEGLALPDLAATEVAARVLGALIESGQDPQPAREPMLDCLRGVLPLCVELADAVRPQIGDSPPGLSEYAVGKWLGRRANEALARTAAKMPEAGEAWQRLQVVWPGAIALLSADPEGRAEAHDLQPLVHELLDLHEAAGWLGAMLGVLHEEPYVAIEPATGTAIAGRMSGVVENFQLNALLMDAVPWTGKRRISRAALAVVTGEGPQQSKETIVGTWQLYSYAALGPDGSLPDAPDPETTIWDEGMPADIPVLDGHRVIVLRPAPAGRSWLAQRMFPSLRASLTREVLDADAVAGWLARIGEAAAATR
jgi:hypothetical protein